MEIGNLVFGCSRGEYPVDRDIYEPVFYVLLWEMRLRKLIDNPYYPDEFENEVFSIFPYYWGDCTCGWDFIDDGHSKAEKLEHRDSCYQHEYDRLRERLRPYGESENGFYRELALLYQKYGWDTTSPDWWHGCALRCTCDYDERLEKIYEEYAREFGHEGHKPDCMLMKPNFFYKPTGYSLKWYKYPLRDSYANRNLSPEEFEDMIYRCIQSLPPRPGSNPGRGRK